MFDFNRIKNVSNPLNVIIVGVIILFICFRVFSNNHENAFVIETIKQTDEKNEQPSAPQTESQTESKTESNTAIGSLAYSAELGKTFTLDAFNKLSKDDLMTFSGVGEVTAQAILDYRRDNGPFKQFEDLMLVKGIGEKKLQKIMTLP